MDQSETVTDSPVVDGVADVLLDAQRAPAGPALRRGRGATAADHPVGGALGLRGGYGGHDDCVPRRQAPVLPGLVALPSPDAVSDNPRPVLESEVFLLT